MKNGVEKSLKEIPSYYLKRKPLLDLIKYSLLRVNESLALELYKIKEGEGFYGFIEKLFRGSEAKNGGLIGPTNVKQTHPILAKILLISEKKQLWPPRKIDDWWVIVRLEELVNTELNDKIALMLACELGDKYLSKESEMINANF